MEVMLLLLIIMLFVCFWSCGDVSLSDSLYSQFITLIISAVNPDYGCIGAGTYTSMHRVKGGETC